MSKSLSFFIGKRYASLGTRNQLVGFISRLSIIGLSLGVAILITALSIINGFENVVQERILGLVPHITVSSQRNSPLLSSEEWQPYREVIEGSAGVLNTSEQLQLQGMLYANARSKGVVLNGINPEQERSVSILNELIEKGDYNSLQAGEYNVIVGAGLAEFLQVDVGDSVMLASTVISISIMGEVPRQKRFTVSGIFSIGSKLDDNLAIVHMNDAQRVYRLGDNIHGLRVQVNDLFAAASIVQNLYFELPEAFSFSDWTRDYGSTYENIRVSKTLLGLLLFLLVAVAAFNVVVSLFMVVRDKQGDIAILRTMGTSFSTIRNIFLIQGFYIGLNGTGIGLALGIFFSLTVSDFFDWFVKAFNLDLLSADVYPVNYLPSQIQILDLVVVCGISLLLCVLATLYPAYSAAKVDPAETLRYE